MEDKTTLENEDVIIGDDSSNTDHTEKEPVEAENTEDKPDTESRYKDAVRGLADQGKTIAKFETEMIDIVRDDPEKLASIKDVRLKNRLAKKIYGVGYDQVVELGYLDQEEKDTDYVEIKHKLAKQEERERKRIENKFFKEKGIIVSDFDEDYLKITDQLNLFSKDVIEEDYEAALEKAFVLANGRTNNKQKEAAIISQASATARAGQEPRTQTAKKKTPNAKTIRMWKALGATKLLAEHGIKL